MAERDPVPLCIDLDGTLIHTDSLIEATLDVLKREPAVLLRIPLWLCRGKVCFKARIAERTRISADSLPYRTDLVAWARDEARARPVVLVTASHRRMAEGVAAHLGFFSDVLATETTNIKGARKAELLVQRFGEKGFDYAGNDTPDLPVWKAARRAVVAGAPRMVADRARSAGNVAREFDAAPSWRRRVVLWIRALRLYQWVKNLLVLMAPAAAHILFEPHVLRTSALAFLAFGLAASAVYVINDLLDLPSDRTHPRKRLRPFASGALPLAHGLAAAPLLIALAIALATSVRVEFAATLLVYLVVTTAYSFWLKRKMFVDAATLAGLYTLRVVAGAVAVDITLSFWLLAVCAYGFLGLALLKRYAELCNAEAQGKTEAAGRDYGMADLPVVLALGVGCSLIASLVTALYIDSAQSRVLYTRPELLWIIVGLMTLGVGRLWSKARRGEMHDDPIVFIVKDRWSLTLLVAGATVVLAAM